MSQDPYAGDNSTPENPYNNPYGTPSQPPYGESPSQSPYGTSSPSQSQTAYGEQPSPYGMPPQGPYGMPGYNPNMPPAGMYGAPGYGPDQGGYAYAASAPLPLGEAIRQLPNQYIKVLTKPSALTFAQEMGKASWDIVWVQLIGYAVIATILGYLRTLIPGTMGSFSNMPNTTSTLSPGAIQLIVLAASLGLIIIVPLSFFIGQGILYLIAKAFGGSGTFLQQSYTYQLSTIPIGIITSLAGLIPFLGSIVAFVLVIYQIVLNVFSIMAVHRLSGGKATAVVLFPVLIAFILVCALLIVIVALGIAVAAQNR